MNTDTHDITVLRELVKKYNEICAEDIQNFRREAWRKHNSLKQTQLLIYVRTFGWTEMPESKLRCLDPFWQPYEDFLRQSIFRSKFQDDFVFEPWLTVKAVYKCEGWGVEINLNHSEQAKGSFKIDYPLKDIEDFEKLRMPWHEIDEVETRAKLCRVQEAFSDLITINLDRGTAYRMWKGDISTHLGYMRGIENIMLDMFINPEWLHKLVAFMSEGILLTHEQAQAKGDWGLCAHENQAMTYANELPDPAPNCNGVDRKSLWCYMAAQEFTGVSPQQHNEFLLQYQLPIFKKFGLVAYGCCEDLTNKIDMLRQIPNLRRIAVSPFADVRRCAEQIGKDYVLSYRPSPSDMLAYDFDPDRIKTILRRDFEYLRGTVFDITLKDVETVQCDGDRVVKWVKLVRQVCNEFQQEHGLS